MEVQNHGVLFEDEVIYKITGKNKTEYQNLLEGAYTSSLDIYKGICSDNNYSIKVSKGGKGIGCGDILRFMKHCRDTEFIIVVGCWDQINSTTKRYKDIYEFYMSPQYYTALWGELTIENVSPFVTYVKSIPEGKSAQLANRKLWKQKRQDLYDQYTIGIASIDAKIDSKKQRRVQCSIKLEELIATGIPYNKYSVNYKEIELPYEQESKPRSFSST